MQYQSCEPFDKRIMSKSDIIAIYLRSGKYMRDGEEKLPLYEKNDVLRDFCRRDKSLDSRMRLSTLMKLLNLIVFKYLYGTLGITDEVQYR